MFESKYLYRRNIHVPTDFPEEACISAVESLKNTMKRLKPHEWSMVNVEVNRHWGNSIMDIEISLRKLFGWGGDMASVEIERIISVINTAADSLSDILRKRYREGGGEIGGVQ